jgi:predicted DNA-binding protein with PD1-like motif
LVLEKGDEAVSIIEGFAQTYDLNAAQLTGVAPSAM